MDGTNTGKGDKTLNSYIAQVSRRTLIHACRVLKSRGFEVWWPVKSEFRIVRNARVIVEQIQLGSYIFISGAEPEKARDYSLLLDADGKWATVHESELAHLRVKKKPEFAGIKKNHTVTAVLGTEERTGVVLEAKSHQRKALVQFPGSAPVWLPMRELERIG